MANLWTPEAERLQPANPSGTLSMNGTYKVGAHVTVGPAGKDASWHGAIYALRVNGGEPHYLYDPVTDRLGQFYPLNVAARTFKRGWPSTDPRSCNKEGSRVIQIEFVAMPDGFTNYWKPGPNFRAMMRDIRGQGVPDVWPGGKVAQSPSDNRRMTWAAYSKASGWIGHSQVPMNDHWDPGPIDQEAIFIKAAMSDPAVKSEQEMLNAQLAGMPGYTPITVNGIDGPQTEKAREFHMTTLKDLDDKIDKLRSDILAALTVPLNDEGQRVMGTKRDSLTVGQVLGGAALAARRAEVVLAVAEPEATEAMRKWASDGGPKPGLERLK